MDASVEAELNQFVGLINKMTGITNSFDYNHCIDMFQRLLTSGVTFDPEEMRVWLVTNGGLIAKDAKSVKAMAQKFRDGKSVRRR